MQPDHSESDGILSPFADTESAPPPKNRKSRVPLWATLILAILIVAGVGGFFLAQYLQDPLRVLEPFPVAKYMENYHALAGSKFRAALRVENDLGWKEGAKPNAVREFI